MRSCFPRFRRKRRPGTQLGFPTETIQIDPQTQNEVFSRETTIAEPSTIAATLVGYYRFSEEQGARRIKNISFSGSGKLIIATKNAASAQYPSKSLFFVGDTQKSSSELPLDFSGSQEKKEVPPQLIIEETSSNVTIAKIGTQNSFEGSGAGVVTICGSLPSEDACLNKTLSIEDMVLASWIAWPSLNCQNTSFLKCDNEWGEKASFGGLVYCGRQVTTSASPCFSTKFEVSFSKVSAEITVQFWSDQRALRALDAQVDLLRVEAVDNNGSGWVTSFETTPDDLGGFALRAKTDGEKVQLFSKKLMDTTLPTNESKSPQWVFFSLNLNGNTVKGVGAYSLAAGLLFEWLADPVEANNAEQLSSNELLLIFGSETSSCFPIAEVRVFDGYRSSEHDWTSGQACKVLEEAYVTPVKSLAGLAIHDTDIITDKLLLSNQQQEYLLPSPGGLETPYSGRCSLSASNATDEMTFHKIIPAASFSNLTNELAIAAQYNTKDLSQPDVSAKVDNADPEARIARRVEPPAVLPQTSPDFTNDAHATTSPDNEDGQDNEVELLTEADQAACQSRIYSLYGSPFLYGIGQEMLIEPTCGYPPSPLPHVDFISFLIILNRETFLMHKALVQCQFWTAIQLIQRALSISQPFLHQCHCVPIENLSEERTLIPEQNPFRLSETIVLRAFSSTVMQALRRNYKFQMVASHASHKEIKLRQLLDVFQAHIVVLVRGIVLVRLSLTLMWVFYDVTSLLTAPGDSADFAWPTSENDIKPIDVSPAAEGRLKCCSTPGDSSYLDVVLGRRCGKYQLSDSTSFWCRQPLVISGAPSTAITESHPWLWGKRASKYAGKAATRQTDQKKEDFVAHEPRGPSKDPSTLMQPAAIWEGKYWRTPSALIQAVCGESRVPLSEDQALALMFLWSDIAAIVFLIRTVRLPFNLPDSFERGVRDIAVAIAGNDLETFNEDRNLSPNPGGTFACLIGLGAENELPMQFCFYSGLVTSAISAETKIKFDMCSVCCATYSPRYLVRYNSLLNPLRSNLERNYLHTVEFMTFEYTGTVARIKLGISHFLFAVSSSEMRVLRFRYSGQGRP